MRYGHAVVRSRLLSSLLVVSCSQLDDGSPPDESAPTSTEDEASKALDGRLASIEKTLEGLDARLQRLEKGQDELRDALRTHAPDPAASTASPASGETEERSSASEGIECEAASAARQMCTIDRAWLDGFLSAPARAIKAARLVPSIKDGEMHGIKFYGIRSETPLHVLGVHNGDMLETVNGTRITSPDQALDLYAELSKGLTKELELAFERRGKPWTLVVRLVE